MQGTTVLPGRFFVFGGADTLNRGGQTRVSAPPEKPRTLAAGCCINIAQVSLGRASATELGAEGGTVESVFVGGADTLVCA